MEKEKFTIFKDASKMDNPILGDLQNIIVGGLAIAAMISGMVLVLNAIVPHQPF
jgi:hypothetical protein